MQPPERTHSVVGGCGRRWWPPVGRSGMPVRGGHPRGAVACPYAVAARCDQQAACLPPRRFRASRA